MTGQTNLAAVFRKDELLAARENYPDVAVEESIQKYGIDVRKLLPEEIPFQFENCLKEANEAEKNGFWQEASEIYADIGKRYKHTLWMNGLEAGVLFRTGELEKSGELIRKVNEVYPTVDTLLLEAKICKAGENYTQAIKFLEQAREILEGNNNGETN